MNTYHIGVYTTDTAQANADGTIDVIGYIANKLELDAETTYTVDLRETDAIGGDSKRTVLNLTADGDTVSTLIASKIRKERKAEREAGNAVDEPAEANTVEPETVSA